MSPSTVVETTADHSHASDIRSLRRAWTTTLHRGIVVLVLAIGGSGAATSVWADAIVVTKAMSASTVVEIFIEDGSIRVELEIGAKDLSAFKNLLPDEIYERLGFEKKPYSKRIEQFFKEDWVIRPDQGNILSGRIASVEARKRVKRDLITGRPLAIQLADAEFVVYAELVFDLEGRPRSVSIQPPTSVKNNRVTANVGFVTYHQGLPVTDFRYLATEETLDLNWEDPWYSRYRNPNLQRKYDSPVSVFLYIEPFEVRKEIVIRPVDLQRWVDLGIDINAVIPVESQPELKRRVGEFLKDKHPVKIDGQVVHGTVDRIHFISRTLRKTGVIYPDEDLPACSATLGVIVIYPIEELPQQVTMTWDSFDAQIQQVPASATDEAGGLPTTLTPDDPVLVWNNYLTHPTVPAMRSVPPPVPPTQMSLSLISFVFVFASLIPVFWRSNFAANRRRWITVLLLSLAVVSAFLPIARIAFANPLAARHQLSGQETDEIMDSLLHNLYLAFDRRQENLVYDQLATSLSEDLLREVYLQTRKRIQLPGQGGAEVKIDHVAISKTEIQSIEESVFSCRCIWMVGGTIGHWGHLHRRELGYEANFIVTSTDAGWKITSLQITDETTMSVQ